jgi:hypothetical protein
VGAPYLLDFKVLFLSSNHSILSTNAENCYKIRNKTPKHKLHHSLGRGQVIDSPQKEGVYTYAPFCSVWRYLRNPSSKKHTPVFHIYTCMHESAHNLPVIGKFLQLQRATWAGPRDDEPADCQILSPHVYTPKTAHRKVTCKGISKVVGKLFLI